MLPCGNEFWMEPCSFHFEFYDMLERKGKIISSSFFGTVKYIKACLKNFLLIVL